MAQELTTAKIYEIFSIRNTKGKEPTVSEKEISKENGKK